MTEHVRAELPDWTRTLAGSRPFGVDDRRGTANLIDAAGLDIPAYHASVHPAVLGRRHVPWEWGVTVACAGVTVQPGDLVIGDGDGVVVLPPGLAPEILADAREQERQEEFVAAQVASGAQLDGLYPIGERWRGAYEAWLGEQAR